MRPDYPEESFLALTDGSVAVFPGEGKAEVLVEAVERLDTPSPELIHRYAEIVQVRGREGSPSHVAAVHLTRRKWPSANL
jgi:hypothetical protein